MDVSGIATLLCACLITAASAEVLSCNFEDSNQQSSTFPCLCDGDACQLVEVSKGEYKWSAQQGSTPSDVTGPSFDHTLQSADGWYIYAEASNRQPGELAAIQTPTFSLDTMSCMTFWYHMYGQHMGSLKASAHFNNGTVSDLWTESGDHGDVWLKATVSLPATVNRITLTAVRGGTTEGMPFGDIALDDLLIERQLCPGETPATSTTSTTTTTPSTTSTTTTITTSTTSTTTSKANSTTASTESPVPISRSTATTIQPATRSTLSTTTTTPKLTRSSASTSTSAPLTTENLNKISYASPVSSTATDAGLTSESAPVGAPTGASSNEQSASTNGSKSVMTTTSANPNVFSETGQQQELWGLDETLWIIILSVAGTIILVLLVIVCVQACAMRRMRSARIVRQSDDFSNIEAYNKENQADNKDKRDNYINAYDNMGMEAEDKPTAQTNGGGLI